MDLPIPLPPSRWEGGSFCLRICLACLLPDAILVSSAPAHREGEVALSPEPLPQEGFLWFSAEVLLHEGAFERLEQRRAPLDAFLLAIDFVNKRYVFSLQLERWHK